MILMLFHAYLKHTCTSGTKSWASTRENSNYN